ncbi:MAG TPA: glycosyltransferase, partial [Acidimicrobiales bacterium]|nr:glycosyltransferase [Acidimicrobiales bacterium]
MNLDVVIVAYNSASRLPKVLDLLPGETHVIVVDNASTDDSADVAEAHGATVVRGSVNAGFAAGCNRGAALGHGKTILFLNPDALIEPEALERLIEVFYDNPQIGVAAPRLVYSQGHKQRVQWPYPSAAGAWREALGLHDRVEESDAGFVVGACLAVRREAFEAVGGFDERFWLYGEEADLCRRIEDLGWTIRRIPSATATHEGGASGGEGPTENGVVFEHFVRGGEHFVDKHGGRGALASYRAANFVGSLGRGVLGVGRRSVEHRRRAARTVRTSLRAPTRVALDSPATAATGKSLVVCSLEAWDDVWRRNQFFVRELLELDPDLRVLFVEPAYDVVHERRRSSGRKHALGLRPVDGEGRIIRFEPVKWVPRKFGSAADDWRDSQVLDAVYQLGFTEPGLWVNDPSYATLADRVDWPAVYDITDDWTEVADRDEADKVQEWEARLFERCEDVTVCSLGLLESRKPLRGDLTLIPNAVDIADMQRARVRPTDLPAGTTAVYVGTLHTDRLDVELTGRLAAELPDVSVVLVGPDALDDESRRQLDDAGVVRVGPKPYAEVPGYLQHADVVIVPHVVSPFTESLDPIKLYECLAVGTATVATPIAGFRDAGGPVRVGQPSQFVDAVRRVLEERPEPRPQPVPSWTERALVFHEVLERGRSLEVACRDDVSRRPGLSSSQSKFQPRRLSRRRGTRRALVINGRFRQRAVTGVERYATELTSRLPDGVPLLGPAPRLARPPLGHVWEQTGLPLEVGPNQLLWSPCNTGPAFMSNQVVTIHDVSPLEHPEWFAASYGRWVGSLTRALARNAEHILVPSQFTRERLVDVCRTPESKITVIPNGVGESFAQGRSGLTDDQRHELGLPEGRFVLGLATEEPRKNLNRVLEAFALVVERHPDVTLVLAGTKGRSAVFAHNDAEIATSAASPIRLGYVADDVIPRLYATASVFVYAPMYEGFGIPPLEAAAARTPSVLADIPPLRELGLPAAWVDPFDAES